MGTAELILVMIISFVSFIVFRIIGKINGYNQGLDDSLDILMKKLSNMLKDI